MLRECHRVMKPGGCIAGYVIHTPAGLGAADEQRALRTGTRRCDQRRLAEDLTREAGFSHVIREDVTGQFRATVEAMLRAARRWAPELRAEQGDEQYAAGCERGEAETDRHPGGVAPPVSVTALKR